MMPPRLLALCDGELRRHQLPIQRLNNRRFATAAATATSRRRRTAAARLEIRSQPALIPAECL